METKTCVICKKEQKIDMFFVKKNRVEKTCKECKRNYSKLSVYNIKKQAVEYKGGKCQSCGYNKYIGALQFHHINPQEKMANWDRLRNSAWDRLKQEIDKCELLCANCHAEKHAKDKTELLEFEKHITENKLFQRPAQEEKIRQCSYCKKNFFAPFQNVKRKYCSKECLHTDKKKKKINIIPIEEKIQLLNNFSQEELAEKYGVCVRTIKHWKWEIKKKFGPVAQG